MPNPGIGRCGRCGRMVTWAYRPETDKYAPGGWHPPLEYAGARYVIVGTGEQSVVHKVASYVKHECDPHQVELFEQDKRDRQEAWRLARIASPEYQEQREADRQWLAIFNQESMKHGCPDCDVVTGEMCLNKTKLRKQVREPVKKCHQRRWRLALDIDPSIGDVIGPPRA